MRTIYAYPDELIEIRVIQDKLAPKTAQEFNSQINPAKTIIQVFYAAEVRDLSNPYDSALRKLIISMLNCVNNECKCGSGGICGQCKDRAAELGITKDTKF